LSERKQVVMDNYRNTLNKALKLIKQYALMLFAIYIGFTILVNFLGFNQPGAVFLISISLGIIILGFLAFIYHKVRKDRKALFDEL